MGMVGGGYVDRFNPNYRSEKPIDTVQQYGMNSRASLIASRTPHPPSRRLSLPSGFDAHRAFSFVQEMQSRWGHEHSSALFRVC
jgi:hypothetical protein